MPTALAGCTAGQWLRLQVKASLVLPSPLWESPTEAANQAEDGTPRFAWGLSWDSAPWQLDVGNDLITWKRTISSKVGGSGLLPT